MRYGMVIDRRKCIGCHTCTIACKVANGTGPNIFWSLVVDREVGTYPSVRREFIPKLCMHCKNARCVDTCPTGASHKREDGIVLVDTNKCVGCMQCILACPYQVRYLNSGKVGYYKTGLTPYENFAYQQREAHTVEKCDLCVDEIEQGQDSVCVRACPLKARILGDLDDPDSEVCRLISSRHGFQLLKELGNEPSVYYLPP
jgi:molybdopterin-containing oxidoreductase family iron-sulfur binding subunit